MLIENELRISLKGAMEWYHQDIGVWLTLCLRLLIVNLIIEERPLPSPPTLHRWEVHCFKLLSIWIGRHDHYSLGATWEIKDIRLSIIMLTFYVSLTDPIMIRILKLIKCKINILLRLFITANIFKIWFFIQNYNIFNELYIRKLHFM